VQLESSANIGGFGAQAFPVTTPASVVQAVGEAVVVVPPVPVAPPVGVPVAPPAAAPPAAAPPEPWLGLLELTQPKVKLAATAPRSATWVTVSELLAFLFVALAMRFLRIECFNLGIQVRSLERHPFSDLASRRGLPRGNEGSERYCRFRIFVNGSFGSNDSSGRATEGESLGSTDWGVGRLDRHRIGASMGSFSYGPFLI